MNRRKTLIPAALVGSVGIALVPALAQASTSSQTSAGSSVGHTLSSAVAVGNKQYSAPVGKSVYSRSAGAAATTPNPGLAVAFTATSSGAFGVTVAGTVTGLVTGSGVVTIDCGADGTGGGNNLPVTPTSDKFTGTCEYSQLGQSHQISVWTSDESGDLARNSLSGVQTAGAYFGAYGPQRLLDTRSGLGAKAGSVAPGGTLKLKVTGLGGDGAPIPAGITAVALNVTAVEPTANGYLSVYGNEDQSGTQLPDPGTSNINFGAGQVDANLVIVPVGKDGTVDFHNNSTGSTQLVADVEGIYTPSPASLTNVVLTGYSPIAPTRIVDTRHGTGTGGKVAQIPANGTITVQMAGVDGIGSNATAVAMNITVTGGARNGVISAYPGNPKASVPTVSNVNYAAGQTTSNMAIVATSFIGSEGHPLGAVSFHNTSSGPVDLVVDAVGYYGDALPTPGGTSAYVPFQSPSRVLDTRQSLGPLPAGQPIDLAGTRYSYETASVLNATVTDSTGNGYLSVYPFNPGDPTAVPTTSNLNYATGQTVPSLVIASPGTTENTKTGTYDFGVYFGGKGTAQLVLDEFGYFANE